MAKVIESKRGNKTLILENFKFFIGSVNKANKNIRWRCNEKSCFAKVYTDNNYQVLSDQSIVHNHEPYSTTAIERQIINSNCKRKAIDDPCTRPKKIILKEISEMEGTSDFTNNDVKRLRKNIYDARKKVLPANPKNIEEVHETLININTNTKQGEPFLLINDEEKHIIIFTCESNMRFLCEIDDLYMDGTFKYAARFFMQMFTIHGIKNGHYIPLVFCLLPDKNMNTYMDTFKFIVDKCSSINLCLSPKSVTTDFEKAILHSVNEIWPQTKIIGCRFHLTQAWYRQLQKLGLSTEYQNQSSEIGIWIRHTFGLLFLEPTEVTECFVEDFMSNRPIDERVEKYSDYLLDYYIDENSMYSPTLWAAMSSSLQRTTNACESFHSRFNQSFYKESPPIIKWLTVLITEIQTDVYIKLKSTNIANHPQDHTFRNRQKKN